MSSAYRSAYHHIIGTRLAEMQHTKEQVEPLLPELRVVYAARVARVIAGAFGIAVALVSAFGALFDDHTRFPTIALVGGAAASVAVYVTTRVALAIGRRVVKGPGFIAPTLTGDLDGDLARIDASSPLGHVLRRLEGLEVYSTALPLAAISLLAPLTLHFLFAATFMSVDRYEEWIRISFIIVGHAHLALMCTAIAFARKMRRMDDAALAEMRVTREWGRALGIAVLVAAMPGVILFAVPPLIALVTGLAFIPFMFVLTRRRLMNERARMAELLAAGRVRVDVDPAEASSAVEELLYTGVPETPLTTLSLVAR